MTSATSACHSTSNVADATGFCSTAEAVKRSGATFRQLDYFVRLGFVAPLLRAQTGEMHTGVGPGGNNEKARRWRPVDVAAARVVADLSTAGRNGRTTALAVLASDAVYQWHGRVPWVVVALPDIVEPAIDANDVAGIVEKLTVATVVPLEASP